jgi:phosphate transport system substrate-binding protein
VTQISRLWAVLAAVALLALGVAACGDDDDEGSGGSDTSGAPSNLSGSIRIDGSSTVGPLTEAVVERFNEENPDVEIAVGQAGTGGGFEKFCAGETDINDASRPIESDEVAACNKSGVKQEEVVVANDALTVVLNPNNPVTCLTVDQLAQIWGPEDTVSSWSDVKGLDAEFDAEVARFGPGTDSGTFDYFTEAINGEEGVQTKDYNNVGEDDNQTVVGVQGSEGGIGYFGYSYFQENQEGLKAAEVENEKGECIAPSEETVQAGDYTPLGRELFIYPSQKALEKPEVKAFVDFYLANVNDIASEIGFIGLTDEQLSKSEAAVKKLG